jgi:hypothetical protein
MTGGFALIAYPVSYRDTGVMTFIVNQDGQVYQKDLGLNTTQIASAMVAYDPDATWQPANKATVAALFVVRIRNLLENKYAKPIERHYIRCGAFPWRRHIRARRLRRGSIATAATPAGRHGDHDAELAAV